jgi:hypothetical protein
MSLAAGRFLVASIALLMLAPGPPIYPGAKRDTPSSLVEKSSGVEASATYVTPDAFEKVDSFYRAHGAKTRPLVAFSEQQTCALLFLRLEE